MSNKITLSADEIYGIILDEPGSFVLIDDNCFDSSTGDMYEIIFREHDTEKLYRVFYEHDYHSTYDCAQVEKYEKTIVAYREIDD